MNDRFKFRVWNKRTEEMLDVRLISYFSTGNICRVEAQNAVGDIKIFDDYKTSIEDIELLQCTGLKDKNGKLIYQGDILGDIYEGLYIHYCQHCHQFQLYSQGYGCMACNGDIHWIEVVEDNKKLEVIGNIYENEDLLKCENQ